MPTEPLRIKGQFFNLRTELSVSPTKGYKPLSREVFRFPAFPIALDITLPPTEETNCLKEVSEILGLNIAVAELNFTNVNIITKQEVNITEINIQPLIIAKQLNVNVNAIAAALKVGPVLAKSKKDQDINKQILNTYLQSAGPAIEQINNVDFIVLTGEMVWSGWLTNNLMAYLISELGLKNNYWNIDKFGLWEVVAHNTIKDKFIRSVSKYYLAPNTFSLRPDKQVKKITIQSQNDSRNILIDGKSRFIENVKDWEFGTTTLPENLIILGLKYNYSIDLKYDNFTIQKRFKPAVRQGEIAVFDRDIKLSIKPGTEIKYGDVIGSYNRKKYKVIKLKDYPGNLKMLVGHGQRVEKDEVIALNNSLSGKVFNEKFTSPIKGVIDLTHKDEGMLFIWSMEEGIDEFMSVFEGKYISGRVGKYHQFYTKMTDLPLDLNLGKQASGILSSGSENIKAKFKKILLIDDIKKAVL